MAVAQSPEIENRNRGDGQTSEAELPNPNGSQICFHGHRLSRSRTKALIEKTVAHIAHADDAVARRLLLIDSVSTLSALRTGGRLKLVAPANRFP